MLAVHFCPSVDRVSLREARRGLLPTKRRMKLRHTDGACVTAHFSAAYRHPAPAPVYNPTTCGTRAPARPTDLSPNPTDPSTTPRSPLGEEPLFLHTSQPACTGVRPAGVFIYPTLWFGRDMEPPP